MHHIQVMKLIVKYLLHIASLFLVLTESAGRTLRRRGYSGYPNNQSCINTIEYIRHHEPDLLYIHDSAVASICGLGSQNCCRSKVEKRLLIKNYQNVTTDIGKVLHILLQDYREYDTLTDALAYTVDKGKENYLNYFRNTFGFHHYKYTAAADSLFQYIRNFTSNYDSSQLPVELYDLFANLFVAASKEFLYLDQVSSSYQQCLRSVYRRFEHYAEFNTLYLSLSGLLQRLQIVLRARETLQQLLDHLTREHEQSLLVGKDCPASLMKMSTCQLCEGYKYRSVSPCKTLCLNTLEGCLAPLLRLKNPLLYQYRMLDQLITQYSEQFEGFGYQFNILAKTTMDFVLKMHENSRKIIRKLKNQCPLENLGRGRRSSPKYYNQEIPSFSDLIPVPVPNFNTALEQFLLSHDRVVLFLHSLPDQLCHRLGAASGNSHCWNGKEIGRYKVKRISSQNPNSGPSYQTHDSFLSYQLDYERIKEVTYSLNDFVQIQACYNDDLQCFTNLPYCSQLIDESGSGASGDEGIGYSSDEENEMGGEDVSDSGLDESLSYSGDTDYIIEDRSSNKNIFLQIAKEMSHTVKTCLPPQFDFSHFSTNTQQIPPTTEPNYFNFTDYNITTDTDNSTSRSPSAGVRNNCIVLLVLGSCLCVLMLL